MSLVLYMLYSDAHLHVNPLKGLGAEKIAKKFKSKGGWFIALVGLPPYHYGFVEPSAESYRKVLDLVNREAVKAKEQGLEVVKFVGVHPAEIDNYYKQGLKPEKLFAFLESVFKLFEDALKNSLLDGIGEVGRQHYGTSPERLVFSEVIMVRALALARDYGVPVQLHLEQGGFVTAYSIKTLANLVKTDLSKIVMHHVNLETATWAEEFNMPFTAPIKQFNEEYATHRWKHCMLESDFLDDPSRPGVSAYPWEIPDVIESFIKHGLLSEEQAYKMLLDNIVKYFNAKPP